MSLIGFHGLPLTLATTMQEYDFSMQFASCLDYDFGKQWEILQRPSEI